MLALRTMLPTAAALYAAQVYMNVAVGYKSALTVPALAWTLLAILIPATWILLLPLRARAAGAAALLAANLALVGVDLCYFRVFRDVPSVRALAFSGQGFDVWESVIEVLRARDLGLAALALGAIAATWWLARRSPPDAPLARRAAVVGLATIAGAGTLGWTLNAANHGRVDYLGLDKLWNRVEASTAVGVLPCHLVELRTIVAVATAPRVEPAERDRLAAWLRDRRGPAVPSRSRAAPGTNVLMIQVEALQDLVVGRTVNGVPVTPALDALRKDARYYRRTYCQIAGGGTSDAEFMAATSLYPTSQGSAFVRFGHQRYPAALPGLLRARGYKTYAAHAFPNPGFWNRTTAYPSLGFGTYLDARVLGLKPKIGLGLSDGAFFERGLDQIERGGEPFMASLVTLSSHHPFRRSAPFGPAALALPADEPFGNYLRSIRYVDDELGKLFARMKASGLWDRTIVVVYGDHPGLFHWTSGMKPLATGPTTSAWDARRLWRIPLFIHVPGDPAPGDQDVVAGQLDIMPTVAGWLGLESPLWLGQDLVTARTGRVGFADGAAIAGDRFHDVRTGGTWDIRTHALASPIPAAELERIRRDMESSEMLLRGDLLPELAGS